MANGADTSCVVEENAYRGICTGVVHVCVQAHAGRLLYFGRLFHMVVKRPAGRSPLSRHEAMLHLLRVVSRIWSTCES